MCLSGETFFPQNRPFYITPTKYTLHLSEDTLLETNVLISIWKRKGDIYKVTRTPTMCCISQ